MPESTETRESRPPFMAGSILGLRRWRSDMLLRRLTSGMSGAEWDATGRATRAVCRMNGDHHSPPDHDCSCGLYAWHAFSRRHWISYRMAPRSFQTVCGVVEAWGRIELHPTGFRAEFAKPVAFVSPLWKDGVMTPQERFTYQDRLFDLAQTCGAEWIDLETESLGSWILNDDRFLSPRTINELLNPDDRPSPQRQSPRKVEERERRSAEADQS